MNIFLLRLQKKQRKFPLTAKYIGEKQSLLHVPRVNFSQKKIHFFDRRTIDLFNADNKKTKQYFTK